jgi:hypothetical protein
MCAPFNLPVERHDSTSSRCRGVRGVGMNGLQMKWSDPSDAAVTVRELPGNLRLMAATVPRIELILSPVIALHLASTIDAGLSIRAGLKRLSEIERDTKTALDSSSAEFAHLIRRGEELRTEGAEIEARALAALARARRFIWYGWGLATVGLMMMLSAVVFG